MTNWFFATDSQTAESLHNEVLTSTTRRLGSNLLHDTLASSRRQKGIEEELSRRIRLMQKIPDSHPREIFVYNDKGFKSFTPEVEDIMGRDYQHRPQKVAVPKYLDYTRAMLKDETEKGKKGQPVLKEAAKGQEEGDDQLKEDYEQLVEEFGAMESEHEQLRGKYGQLRKDHADLQKEHMRALHELSGRREMQGKVPEQRTASAPLMRPRDEGIKQAPMLGGRPLPPGSQNQAREAVGAQEVRERANVQAREKEAREQEQAKIREWEEANFVKELEKRERELREERVGREQQRMRAPPKVSPGAGRLDIKAGDAGPLLPRHSIYCGPVESKPTTQTENLREPVQSQKTGYPNMPQYPPYQPKPAFLRQANDSKSVSFDLPTKTPNMDQEPSAEQKPDLPQQRGFSKSVSVALPTGKPTMGEIFPAQQPPVQQPLTQQPPVQRAPFPQAPHRLCPGQQFPFQQRSVPLRQGRDTTSLPYGPPTGTPNMGHLFPVQQRSAPLQQTNESKNVSFNLPATTASTPTNLRVPTLSSQTGPRLGVPPRSQEPLRSQESSKGTNFDQGRMGRRVDEQPFLGRPDAP